MNIVLGPPTRLGRLAMLCGVLAITFGLVSAVSAAPQPGSTCKVAGRERVTSAGTLRCVASSGRSLRWVQVAAPVVATTTTTTTTSSSTTTTVAASARAPQVSAISVDDSRVRFTLSGMSPDTGNYAVQWVNKGQSFNTYRMLRFTDKNVSISTAEFACGRPTLTFRVYVMRADWQLADGHQRQNVTPHSEPFDITMTHACPATETTTTTTTTTVAPLSCAAGGTCAVGDTGPGGGIVFYVHPSGTFSCGGALTSTCKYLEAAPTSGSSSWTDSEYKWSGEEFLPVGTNARGTAIGTGYRNTLAIVNQNSTASRAGTISRSYRGPNSQSDWYLPSQDELNELCKFARRQTTGATATLCDGSGSLRSGFAVNYYWSSTEIYRNPTYSDAWLQDFSAGSQIDDSKQFPRSVRPIRAFGGTLSCADGGACIVGDTGPGGGIVFYVHSGGGTFTSTGSDCGTSCKYLEAAGSDQSTGVAWCSDTATALGVSAVSTGSGMTNTTTADTTCTSGAIQIAADYSNNGKTDWHLPSNGELNHLFSARMTVGGFSGDGYWSSSEAGSTSAYIHNFGLGNQIGNSKTTLNRVRVVRAF